MSYSDSLVSIGVPHSDYNSKRNILDSLPVGFRRVRPWDPGRARSAARWRLSGSINRADYFFFREPYFPRADMFHFWNSVADIARPWVSSFEHTIPLWDAAGRDRTAFGMQLAQRDECCRLIAFSESARRDAIREWQRLLPSNQMDRLIAKTEVLLPPQAIISADGPAIAQQPTTFAFVGKEFYRKGGLEILEAFRALLEAGKRNWTAVVIGDLESFGDYASCSDKHDRNRAWALLQSLDTHVRFIPTPVPHRDVLALLQRSEFYLLPTYADTFGYTALEAQACGTVVVATDVGSLPEFISSRTGIVVPLDEHLDGWRLPPSTAKRVKADFTDRLSFTLASALEISLEKRNSLRAAAIEQLRRRHCPRHHSLRLETIYREALTP